MSDDYHIPADIPGPNKYDYARDHLDAVRERVWDRVVKMFKVIGDRTILEIKYDIAGKPYGDDEAGFSRFIVEQAIKEEMEIVKDHYGRNDADIEPN